MFPCSLVPAITAQWKLTSRQDKGHLGFPQNHKRNVLLRLYHLPGLEDTGHTSHQRK